MALVDKYIIPEGQYDEGQSKGTKRAHQIRAHLKSIDDSWIATIVENIWLPNGKIFFDMPMFQSIVGECRDPGEPLNLNWMLFEVCQEAYMRDIINDQTWSNIQEELC